MVSHRHGHLTLSTVADHGPCPGRGLLIRRPEAVAAVGSGTARRAPTSPWPLSVTAESSPQASDDVVMVSRPWAFGPVSSRLSITAKKSARKPRMLKAHIPAIWPAGFSALAW